MVTDQKRKVTEGEVDLAENAFTQFIEWGHTEQRCPWCADVLQFDNAGSSYSIGCVSCDFKVTARGI